MTVLDRRIIRTRGLLREALIALSRENGYDGYDALTVKEITARAQIAYSTFFRRYPDKDALFEEMITETVEDLQRLFAHDASKGPEVQGKLIFEHIKAHEDIYRLLFDTEDGKRLMQQMRPTFEKNVADNYRGRGAQSLPLEIVAYHVVTSILSLVNWWLSNSKKYSTEQMGHIYAELVIRATDCVV